MKNFIEWCKQKGLTIEACNAPRPKYSTGRPVAPHSAKKMPGEKGDTQKYSGTVRKQYKDLSPDYKGNHSMFGTDQPFDVKAKGNGKPVADVGK